MQAASKFSSPGPLLIEGLSELPWSQTHGPVGHRHKAVLQPRRSIRCMLSLLVAAAEVGNAADCGLAGLCYVFPTSCLAADKIRQELEPSPNTEISRDQPNLRYLAQLWQQTPKLGSPTVTPCPPLGFLVMYEREGRPTLSQLAWRYEGSGNFYQMAMAGRALAVERNQLGFPNCPLGVDVRFGQWRNGWAEVVDI